MIFNILTVLNSIFLIYFLTKNKFYIEFSKEKTFIKNKVISYNITLWKNNKFSASGIYTIVIPIKNKKKIELEEEVQEMMGKDNQNKIQRLNAKFSWLKTLDEVKQFEKDYSVVDEKFVKKLVSGFILNKVNNLSENS